MYYNANDMIEFAMNMIAQFRAGNTNIWNRELLKESLPEPATPSVQPDTVQQPDKMEVLRQLLQHFHDYDFELSGFGDFDNWKTIPKVKSLISQLFSTQPVAADWEERFNFFCRGICDIDRFQRAELVNWIKANVLPTGGMKWVKASERLPETTPDDFLQEALVAMSGTPKTFREIIESPELIEAMESYADQFRKSREYSCNVWPVGFPEQSTSGTYNIHEIRVLLPAHEIEWLDETPSTDDWISVEKELPEVNEKVLAYCNDVQTNWIGYDKKWVKPSWPISHWRPLPKPPQTLTPE